MENFDTEHFIAAIRIRPPIWDSSSADYTDKQLKKKCWEQLVEIFGGKRLSISDKKELGYILQKKWKSIRGSYTRELGRKKSLKSGQDLGSRKNEYVYFQQLQFLENVVSLKEGGSELQKDLTGDEIHHAETHPAAKRLRTSEPEDDFLSKILRDIVEKIDSRETLEQDEDRLFLLSLVDTLKRVPQDKKMAVKVKLMSILDEATQHSIQNKDI